MTPKSTRPSATWLLAVLALALVGWYLVGDAGIRGTGAPSFEGTVDKPETSVQSSVEVVVVDDLPPEASITLRLIADGGPYPFARDDGIFQNRERLLPLRDEGFYREYTVRTPGASDRGSRRIVAGADGARYYTDDHYSSFREIIGDPG